jgi:hypothetical protein
MTIISYFHDEIDFGEQVRAISQNHGEKTTNPATLAKTTATTRTNQRNSIQTRLNSKTSAKNHDPLRLHTKHKPQKRRATHKP